MNKFLKEFKDRGFFYQCTSENELSNLLDNEKINGYIGFDCTAESLHVGSLLQIMCLRLLQKHGQPFGGHPAAMCSQYHNSNAPNVPPHRPYHDIAPPKTP